MNKIYRTVFNAATGKWAVASELAKGRKKNSKTALAVAVAALLALPAGAAFAEDAADEEDETFKPKQVALNTTSGTIGTSGIGTMATDAELTKYVAFGTGQGTWDVQAIAAGHGMAVGGASEAADYGTAVGGGAKATGAGGASAFGAGASATGGRAIAIGADAHATATGAIALGENSLANVANTVSVGNATTQRRIVNLADGTQDTDAVNLRQLNTKIDDTYFKVNPSGVGGAATANGQGNVAIGVGATADTAVDGHAIAIGSGASATAGRAIAIGRAANASAFRSISIGQFSSATHTDSVALGTDSVTDRDNSVSVGSATQQRQITNVAAGTQATDAANFSQLQGTAQSVATAIGGGSTVNPDGTITAPSFTVGDGSGGTTIVRNVGDAVSNLDGRVTTNEGDITNLQQQIGNGTIGLVQQANAGDNLTVGAATDGAAVDFTGTAGERKLIGVANGDVSATSKEAINGSQLHGVSDSVASAIGAGSTVNPDGTITAPSFSVGDGKGGTTVVHNVGDAVSNLDGRVTTNEGDITNLQQQIGNGTIGLVQQANAGDNLTVGAATDGAAVDFTGTAGERKLIGVAAGDVSATSKEAINGSQLHGVSDSVATAIGAGSTVNPDGTITAPSFSVGDGKGGTTVVHNVGDAVTNLDGRVTTNEGDITNLQQQIGNGTIGLVQQANAGDNLTVGAATDGAAVDFTGTAGERKLIGVAAGDVSATSKEAINGSQLHGVSDSVASAIGAGSTVNPDGSISQPTFSVGDGNGGTTVVHNVGDAVTNLDGRMGTAETNITQLQQDVNNGAVGLVRQDATTQDVTVASGTGGNLVNFAGTAGDRRLTGVANGVADNDAASIAQLKAMGLFDPNTNLPMAAVVYDGIDLSSVTFGGNGGTRLKNVAAGVDRTDAVNYGQLTDLEARWDGKWNDLSDRVDGIENGSGAPGGPGNGSDLVGAGTGENSLVVGKGADASGSNSTATGNDSVASGDSSTAIGQGAKATHERSVAIGAGSETSRQDEVSFGAPGQERYLGNVKDGERDTDAVNVRQLNNAVTGLNNKVDSARSDAMGGVAAAMAVAGLPQSSMPGKTFMAIAGSTYGGEYGTAIGASYMTKDGKWVVKGAVNTSSRGEVGAVVGGGFYW